jgi:hypothetical protein
MSDFSIRPYVSHTTSFFAKHCPSFLSQRQKMIQFVALAAVGLLSYVLYRYLTTKTDPKENRKLRKLQTKIQEEKQTAIEENQAISLSPPYGPIKKIKFYQRLDELVRKGFIHSWFCSNHQSVYIKFKKEDNLHPYQTCKWNALPNNRSGWRDRDLISLEDTFRKENPLKEPEETALQELTPKERESIQHVLLELKARGKPGVCHLPNPDSTFALSFLKTHGIIHSFKETPYFANLLEVFITAEDQEIEKQIESLAFPDEVYDFSIKRDIQEAYRQRLTEGKRAAFTIQVDFIMDSRQLDTLARAKMISWRRLKQEKDSRQTPVLVRFSAHDPVEQAEEAFDHTEYPDMKAGWRTREHLEEEERLRSVNQIVINDRVLNFFFKGYSPDNQSTCELLLCRLNQRVQTGPYLLEKLGVVEQPFLEFLQERKAIFRLEWLDTLKTKCKVFVHAFDDNETTASSL